MYFGIYDNYTVKNIKPKGRKPVIIRIADSKDNLHYFSKLKNYHAVLNMIVSDDDSFTCDNLNELNKFIIDNDFDEIIFHCTAGVSRSPAIAVAVSRMISEYEMERMIVDYEFFIPNKHIIDTVDKCCYSRKKVKDGKLIFRNIENYYFDEYDIPKKYIKKRK